MTLKKNLRCFLNFFFINCKCIFLLHFFFKQVDNSEIGRDKYPFLCSADPGVAHFINIKNFD